MKQVGLFILLFLSVTINAQEHKLYNPDADAMAQLDKAIVQAKSENKHVMIIVGGNWCPWCIKMDQFMHNNYSVDSLLTADYILVHLNYSKENKNPAVMARLEYPQRFGFPVIVILNETGKRIHTQNTAYLEEKDSYSRDKYLDFLKSWNKKAVNSENYR